MAYTPTVYGPDGVQRTLLTFTTTFPSRFITGEIDDNTVEVQVSIRGGSYSSDPDFITFEGEDFIIPNPSSYPDGLDLIPGLNTILIRTVDTVGSISAPATVNINLVQEKDAGLTASAPTGITIERKESKVKITIERTSVTDSFRGINFYASTSPGGGVSGYYKINSELVTDYETVREYKSLASLPVDIAISLTPGGDHAADPLYFNVVGTQQDNLGTIIATSFNESLEIPENITNIRSTIDISKAEDKYYYSFDHNRLNSWNSIPSTIPRSDFRAIQATDPVYYVATAVYYDTTRNLEIESPFSPEVVGYPMSITIAGGSLPVVTKDQILNNMAISINRNQPEVSLQPGSVLRDTVIDPTVFEVQRIRFLVDFVHRSQSFSDLLKIDDPSGSGSSIAVPQSQYKNTLKQALYLTNDSDVQSLIDQSFDKLAQNFGLRRLQGLRSVGEVTFYTTKRPDSTKVIPVGTVVSGGSRRFRTTSASEIRLDTIASFYNGITGRYSVRVPVQAEEVGESGNVSPGQIKSVVSGVTGVSVVNESKTYGGTSIENNRDLATRAMNVLSSVDSGTEQGYNKNVVALPGIEEVRVVGSGDPLMQRDFDGSVHRGGKVDIWVRGTRTNTVTDSFAFSFRIVTDIQFELTGDPADLVFSSVDPALTLDNPIIEMLTYYNYGLRNETTGEEFDLTGYSVDSYNTIRLSTSIPQPAVSSIDVVRGDYRYRDSNNFIMTRQPVGLINSFTGTVSGVIDTTKYYLWSVQDPSVDGMSSRSVDGIVVTSDSGVPSGIPIQVTDEDHVLIAENIDYLENLGANPLTIEVWDSTKTTQYNGPFSASPDFTVIDGDERNPVGIKRTSTSTISSGQPILIDYYHDENFVINYTTNFLVSEAQDVVDEMRHATADVLAKSAISTMVDIEATVVLKRGSSPSVVDSDIRTNISNYMNGLGMGDPLRPSDFVGVVENTVGVSYVVLPLTKMVRSSGTPILRETVVSDRPSDYVKISSWSNGVVETFLLFDALENSTYDNGGPSNRFRMVFADEASTDLVITSPSGLMASPMSSFIIGDYGYQIPGYSDDATLIAQGYTDYTERVNRRIAITSNRILVGLPFGDVPSNHDWTVTYITSAGTGVRSIETGEVESLDIGIFTFTYDEDTK